MKIGLPLLVSLDEFSIAILSRMSSISVRIKDARKLKKLTQAQVAEELGVTTSAVSQWEQGATEPSISNLEKLSRLLDVTFEWLATGRGISGIEDYLVDITAMYKADDRLIYLSEDQKRFVEAFATLPPQWQQRAVEVIEAIAKGIKET